MAATASGTASGMATLVLAVAGPLALQVAHLVSDLQMPVHSAGSQLACGLQTLHSAGECKDTGTHVSHVGQAGTNLSIEE